MSVLRKMNNDLLKLKDLQKRLNNLQNKKYNLILEELKNKENLNYIIKFVEKTSKITKKEIYFFDKTDVLFYIKGLEELNANFKDYK